MPWRTLYIVYYTTGLTAMASGLVILVGDMIQKASGGNVVDIGLHTLAYLVGSAVMFYAADWAHSKMPIASAEKVRNTGSSG